MRRMKILGLGLTLLSLTGCASLNSQFDCPLKPGVMCKSIDQVNTMVNRGELGQSATDNNCPTCQAHAVALKPVKMTNVGDFTTPYPIKTVQPGDPVRYAETVMRIWIAPYQDKNGNYYQPVTLYTVIKPGHWLGQPVTAINQDGDPV